tara:strand:+ start:338 stop:1273 length:936 start_codon:yes stop_codon:yes gene_type:complete
MITSASGFNAVLSGYASEWWNQNTQFVGAQLAPMFRTGEQAAAYAVFNKENFLNRPVGIKRAPGTPYSTSNMQLSEDTFNCEDRGHVVPVDETQRKKYRNQFDADFAAIRRAMSVVRYNHELEVKALVDAGAVPGATPSTKWDAGGTPIADFDAAVRAFRDGSGLSPNTMTMSQDVADVLFRHSTLVDLFKYSQVAVLGAEDIARVFRIPRVIIAGEYQESAAEGLTSSITQIWGDDVVLSHTVDTPDLDAPNAFRTFVWTEDSGGEDDIDVVVESFTDDDVRSEKHRVRHNTDVKTTGSMLVRKLTSVLT